MTGIRKLVIAEKSSFISCKILYKAWFGNLKSAVGAIIDQYKMHHYAIYRMLFREWKYPFQTDVYKFRKTKLHGLEILNAFINLQRKRGSKARLLQIMTKITMHRCGMLMLLKYLNTALQSAFLHNILNRHKCLIFLEVSR